MDIKEFLSGVNEQEEPNRDISYLEANMSAIDPNFLCDDGNKDIILCISNLDIKDLDDGLQTQSAGKFLNKIVVPRTKATENIRSLDIQQHTKNDIEAKKQKCGVRRVLIWSAIAILISITIFLISYIVYNAVGG
jgi:hypothetical protein